jgi:hypothetical protein
MPQIGLYDLLPIQMIDKGVFGCLFVSGDADGINQRAMWVRPVRGIHM